MNPLFLSKSWDTYDVLNYELAILHRTFEILRRLWRRSGRKYIHEATLRGDLARAMEHYSNTSTPLFHTLYDIVKTVAYLKRKKVLRRYAEKSVTLDHTNLEIEEAALHFRYEALGEDQ